MADLQEELQRFLTARFGVDVKDAFVSCIQKIHKENQDVAALEQPMKDATQQVLDIREEVVTASQNAVQTADDAKTIARAAESSSSEALATAKNAKDEYYDEIEICLESAEKHFKSAHQVRNRSMVDRSDLVIFCIEHNSGGAYQTMQYAKKADAKIMNLPDVPR